MGRRLLPAVLAGVAAAAVVSSPASSTLRSAAGAGPDHCPVTLPNGKTFPSQGRDPNGYRVGQLWVELWPYGVTLVGKADVTTTGGLSVKIPWYRHGRGRLTITATRLDEKAPPAQANVPPGYGLSGFQSSGVTFPSEGCWKITGTAGTARLTFVTIILRTKTVRQEVPLG